MGGWICVVAGLVWWVVGCGGWVGVGGWAGVVVGLMWLDGGCDGSVGVCFIGV